MDLAVEKGERDGGTRLDSKLQPGKSNSARVISTGALIGGKSGSCDGPSHDCLLYIMTCLIGHAVEVQVKNGSVYSGIFHATSDEKELGVVLKMARLIKEGTFREHRAFAESVIKAPSKTFIIPANELVQITAKEVAVPRDGMANELQHDKLQELMIDSIISQSRRVDVERELEPWIPDENDPQFPELDNIFDDPQNRTWDQFETNEKLFGVKTTFNVELYTTKLLRGPQTKQLEREAMRLAREIEGEDTQDLHLAEERGINLHEKFDIDEETKFSSVYRGPGFGDSGYEEDEDIILDSRNNETFGDYSGSVNKRSADLTSGKSNDTTGFLSSPSLVDEAQSSESGTGTDLCCSPHDHARQMVSEIPDKSFSTVDSESRILENLLGEHGANSDVKSSVEQQLLPEDALLPKSGDSLSSQGSEMDGSDKAGQSANVLAYAPSHVSLKPNDKTSSPGVQLEAAVSSKGPGELQSVISRARPGSSASSNSDYAAAAAAPASTASGLSPSSSMGSLSSEKSTLNPHAKEFKLNPNAKSFIPSQASARPLTPVADSAFYHPPNVSGVAHNPELPMGFGIGPSFALHQPVLYNMQVTQMQSPQAYYHPHGPQYGQQMLVGQQRPVFYMSSYHQPDMQYKG